MRERTIILAGGCFWGVEKYLDAIPGVVGTRTGYANSRVAHPSYQQVCAGGTDAAEAVRVRYDADALGLDELLALFFEAIDPTSLDRQGHDVGHQYRTGVFWTDDADAPLVRGALARLQAAYPDAAIVVEAAPLGTFYDAEEYHQHYLDKNPTGYCHLSAARIEQAPHRLAAL
ncbi:MAG: peptide-methionine (S)-S-oxide reductase MsrA, partial [Propionibacteriaceae bacterium]|nr:peptide-methionine (S)-S-oxide reductase MsrA [Propionibacteriaceae bacterium]